MTTRYNNEVTLTEKFTIFRELLDLCSSRGYDPEGASLDQVMRYRGLKEYRSFDKNGKCYWALVWETMVDYEDYGPASGENHPAILFKNGREEWHERGLLDRRGDAAVINSKGQKKYFVKDKEVKTVEETLKTPEVPK